MSLVSLLGEKKVSRIYCLQITICDHQVCSIGPVGTIYG